MFRQFIKFIQKKRVKPTLITEGNTVTTPHETVLKGAKVITDAMAGFEVIPEDDKPMVKLRKAIDRLSKVIEEKEKNEN